MRPTKVYTLVLLHKGNKVLLGLKKRGFGVGKWNGFGGKVEKTDKSIKDGAIREVHEECHITCNNLEYIAKITFEFKPGSTKEDLPLMEVHVFKGEENDFVSLVNQRKQMKCAPAGLTKKMCHTVRCGLTTATGGQCTYSGTSSLHTSSAVASTISYNIQLTQLTHYLINQQSSCICIMFAYQ